MRVSPLLAFVPFLALAACSPGEDPGTAPVDAAPVAAGGGPSVDGPLMNTEGLWRTTTTVNGRQAFGANRACVSPDSQKAHDIGGNQAAAAGCSAPRHRSIAGGYAFETVCELDGVKTTMSGQATGDAKRVTIVTNTRTTGPEGEVSPETTVRVESVHLGACPAGMKPGDTVQEGMTAP